MLVGLNVALNESRMFTNIDPQNFFFGGGLGRWQMSFFQRHLYCLDPGMYVFRSIDDRPLIIMQLIAAIE